MNSCMESDLHADWWKVILCQRMCVFVYDCNLQKAERGVILQQMVALQGSPAQSQA